MSRKQIGWMIILGLILFTTILESMILMPLASTIKSELGMDEKQWGVAISVYLFSAFISGILSIFLIDKYDRKTFLLALYVFFIVGTFFCGIATSYYFLVFARIFAGFFGGVISALTLAMVGDLVSTEFRGRATGIVMAGFSSAAALGIPIGLYLGLKWNWHTPFYFIFFLSLIILFLIWMLLPSLKSHIESAQKVNPIAIFKRIIYNSNQKRALLFNCTILFGQFAIIPFLADFIQQNAGFQKTELVWMYFTGGVLTFFSNPFVGFLSDKYGKLRVFLILMALSCVPIILITSMTVYPIYIVLLATSAFFVFAGGRNIPGTAIVIATAAPYERGGFMAIRSALQQLASGLAVMISSFIVYQDETGKYFNFEYVGYLAVATSIISYLLLRNVKQIY